MNTTVELQQQAIAQAARRLLTKLPAGLRDDPDAAALAELRCEAEVAVVHLIYRSKHYESHSKDYEFSRVSMEEHWRRGAPTRPGRCAIRAGCTANTMQAGSTCSTSALRARRRRPPPSTRTRCANITIEGFPHPIP
jgi:hypothetical protein